MNNERLRILLANAVTLLEEHLNFTEYDDFEEYLKNAIGIEKDELVQL